MRSSSAVRATRSRSRPTAMATTFGSAWPTPGRKIFCAEVREAPPDLRTAVVPVFSQGAIFMRIATLALVLAGALALGGGDGKADTISAMQGHGWPNHFNGCFGS